MRRRSFLAFSGGALVCGCSGAVHQLPTISERNLASAQAEVRAPGASAQWRGVSDDELLAVLEAAGRRILRPASVTCGEIGVGVCGWTFRVSRSHSLNAAAYPAGLIVVNRGIVEYAANEEEICLVIAHEIAHQAANHVV